VRIHSNSAAAAAAWNVDTLAAMANLPAHPLTPFPRGWYLASYSDELKVGEVKPLHLFSRDLVLFRDSDGKAHIADAHCPHLGAHLGHGGKVVGDCIRCPFHGWTFHGGTGECRTIPLGDPVPPKARLERWPVVETSSMVLVWFHEQRGAPTWDVGEFADFDEPGWSAWHHKEWHLRARIQDIAENDADFTHTPAVHNFTDGAPVAEMDAEGARCGWQLRTNIKLAAFGVPRLPGVPETSPTVISVTRWGLSLGWISQVMQLPMGQSFRSQTLATTTPLDGDHVRLTLRHRIRNFPVRPLTNLVLSSYSRLFNNIVAEDILIWENKIYRPRPVASRSDWAILKFRRWARQFYDPVTYDAAFGRAVGPELADVAATGES
jgi:nitrite reductase/ring-hydroxylating ferredoxin subunit